MDIYVWKLLLKNLVLPPAGPLILSALGLALAASAHRRLGLTLAGAGVALLWLLATPICADALVRSVEIYPPLDLGKPTAAQAIVILSGGVRLDAPEYGRSVPNATTLERLLYGGRIARATALPVLVSGSRIEAVAMSEFLAGTLGVMPRWIESHSRDTHENATRSAAILEPAGIHRIVLVTSSAHMARAVAEFRATGLAVVPAPAEMWTRRDPGILAWEPNVDALMRSQRALYEILGQRVQRLRFALAAHGLLPAAHPKSHAGHGGAVTIPGA